MLDLIGSNELQSKEALKTHSLRTPLLAPFLTYDRLNQQQAIALHKLELEESLDEAKTYQTRILGKIYISREVVSASPLLVALLALFVGFFGALASALIS